MSETRSDASFSRKAFPARVQFGFLILLSLASLAFALSWGSVDIPFSEVVSALFGEAESVYQRVILDLRLPRALAAFAVGGLLALAGVLMQVLLRNPLGDPYILGVSGGAATAALSAMLFGFAAAAVPVFAFGGALASVLLVFGIARATASWTPVRLLLTGVVLASGWGAAIGLILALGTDTQLPGMLFWLLGDLSGADSGALPLVVLIAGTVAAWFMARPLNLLIRGEDQAAALGVEVMPLRLGLFALSSLLTAIAVSVGGSIGFVGLVVPHLFRLAAGSDHRRLIPGSVLLGGSLLTVADTLARSIVAPQQLPVGVITALLGVPLFLFLLNRGKD